MQNQKIYTILSSINALIQCCESYYYTKTTLILNEDSTISLQTTNEKDVFSFLRVVCLLLGLASVFFYVKEHKRASNVFTILVLIIFTPPKTNGIVHVEVDYQVDSIISIISTFKFLEIIKLVLINNEYYKRNQQYMFSFKSLNQFQPLMLISSISAMFIFVFSYIIFVLELNKQPENFYTLFQSGYFVIIAVTTVGYGELIPKTQIGKILTNFLCLSGQVLLSLLVIILISLFTLSDRNKESILGFEKPYTEDNKFKMILGRVDPHANISKLQQGIMDELDSLIEQLEHQKQQQLKLEEIENKLENCLQKIEVDWGGYQN